MGTQSHAGETLFPPNAADAADLPDGFLDFLAPLHEVLTPWQRTLIRERTLALDLAARHMPDHRRSGRPFDAVADDDWRVELPGWITDQRNQMTGPADDADLVVKMLNSGAPGVMIDLEDSMANTWDRLRLGIDNAVAALHGTLTYVGKDGGMVGIRPSGTIVYTRVRGLHMSQHGVYPGQAVAAPLFDAALLVYKVDPGKLRHPLCVYIPKSESWIEAIWWRELFARLARAKGLPDDAIKCMALVESHPMAYQMEEFVYALRDHLLGLNLGRWDYMASLIHFTLADPRWVLPDRNTIPHDVPFFQNLRELLPEICHKRGIFAIGGMTALYPSRTDHALNARALALLGKDKKNEADARMDGAWTGHPDQNAIAVAQFPFPNQLSARKPGAARYPDLRPLPIGIGATTLDGTRAAVRTVIRYRHGVLSGRGASLLDGYMEDLATDRIYRLMIAQRLRHAVEAADGGATVRHTPELVRRLFEEELERILATTPGAANDAERYRQAALASLGAIERGEFDPT